MTLIYILFLILMSNYYEGETAVTPVCLDGEEFNRCTNPCEPTCQRPMPQGCEDLECVSGCVCPEGFVREFKNGKCISKERCETSCREHETFDNCGLACPGTCQDLFPKCIKMCVKACVCANNFVMQNNVTDLCIPQTSCALDLKK